MAASAAEEIYNSITKHSVDLMRVEEGVRRSVVKLLKQLEKEIVASLKEIDPESPIQATYRIQRQKKLLAQVRESIRSTYKTMREDLTGELTELAESEGDFIKGAINKAVKGDIATVGITRGFARSVATTSLIQGTVMSDWMSRLSGSTYRRVNDEVKKGMLAGETIGDIVRRIRGRAVGRGVYAGGVMNTTTREATVLARTAVQTIANKSRHEMLKANSDVIKGYQAVVTLDNRTSDICKAKSGEQWDLNGKPIPNTGTTEDFPGPPPWHYQCRSTLIPIIKDWNELSNQAKSRTKNKMGTQAAMNGKVPAHLNYEQWLRKQPKAVQIEALGKSKYELWKSGKIKSFRDLTDQTGRPLTVAELRESTTGTP